MLFPPFNPPFADWRGQRVWLIGASSGIGAALAQALAARGASVALSARQKPKLENVAQGLANSVVLPMDVTKPDDWAAAHTQLLTHWDAIDLIIFCAADYRPQRSWEVTPASAERTIAVNLTSVYQGLSLVLPPMLARGKGSIAVIASVAGYMGLPNATVYGPTKAALINLAEILYADLHPRGLGVYLINPGFVQTPLTAHNDFAMPAIQTPEQAANAILRGFARGRFEISFPKRFTCVLHAISLLPYRLRFSLLSRALKLS